MKFRSIASALVAAALLTGTAGCGVFVESATLKPYAASDGVNANVGDLKLRNMLLIANMYGDVALIGTVINDSGENVSLQVGLPAVAGASIATGLFTGLTRLDESVLNDVVFNGTGLKGGQLADVEFQYGNSGSVVVSVPVLDWTDPLYAQYAPVSY